MPRLTGLSLPPNPKPGGRSPGPGTGSLTELAPGGLRSRAGRRLPRTRARRASVPGRAPDPFPLHLGGQPSSPSLGLTFTWPGATGGSRITRHRSASQPFRLCTGPSGALTFWQVALERTLRAISSFRSSGSVRFGLGPVLSAPADQSSLVTKLVFGPTRRPIAISSPVDIRYAEFLLRPSSRANHCGIAWFPEFVVADLFSALQSQELLDFTPAPPNYMRKVVRSRVPRPVTAGLVTSDHGAHGRQQCGTVEGRDHGRRH